MLTAQKSPYAKLNKIEDFHVEYPSVYRNI